MKYYDLKVGDIYEKFQVVEDQHVLSFAQITGDKNPVHLDEEYAKNSVFGGRIAHGILLLGYISAVLGMEFPGPGTIYMSQNAKFLKPVYIGEKIKIVIKTVEKDDNKKRAKLSTNIYKESGELAVEGEAMVSLKFL
ncbi:MaoC family dehydratase [Thermosipho globiformans]|uniref:MaoC family dehydratase n=1 Tax=Thermosipho globiformans TaxID=380685 RepID=UPI000F8D7E28|nr:MaoC family dehydratase [Thermosipho globiformans]